MAIVGNEDGAHKITADVFQALNDVGFTIPAGGATYSAAPMTALIVGSGSRTARMRLTDRRR